MLIFGFYIAQNNKNPHVTLFKHCISKTARYSILTPLVKKSYLGDKLLNPEYQVIASRPFIYQQIQCEDMQLTKYIFGDPTKKYKKFLTIILTVKKIIIF